MPKPLSTPFSNSHALSQASDLASDASGARRDMVATLAIFFSGTLIFSSTAFDVADYKLPVFLCVGALGILLAHAQSLLARGIVLALLLLPLVLANTLDRQQWILGSARLWTLLSLVLLAMAISWRSNALQKLGNSRIPPPLLPLFGIVIWGRVSWVTHCDHPATPLGAHDDLLLLLTGILTLIVARSGWTYWTWLRHAIASAGALIAGVALLQAAGISIGFPQTQDAVSLFGNTNHVGLFLAPIAVFMAWSTPRLLGVGGMIATLCAAGVILSQSRGAALAMGMGMLVAVLFSSLPIKNRITRPLVLLSTAALVAVLLKGPAVLQFKALDQSQESIISREYPSNLIRVEVLNDSARLIQDAPILGHGPGAFRIEYPRYQSEKISKMPRAWNAPIEVTDPHNDFAWLAVERGAPAAVLWLVTLLGFFWRSLGLRRLISAPSRVGYPAALAGAMVALGFESLTQTLLQQAPALLLLSLFGGMSLSGEPPVSTDRSGLSKFSGPGTVLFLLLILWSGLFGWSSQHQFSKVGQASEISSNLGWATVREALESSLKADPSQLDALRVRADFSSLRALSSTRREDIDHAIESLKALKKLMPQEAWADDRIARLLLKRGDKPWAIRFFDLASRILPTGPSADERMKRAETFLQERNLYLKQEVSDLLENASTEKASEYHERGQLAMAKIILETVITQQPESADAHYLMGRILRDEDNAKGSDRFFYRAQVLFATEWILKEQFGEARTNLRIARRYRDDPLEIDVLEAFVEFRAAAPDDPLSDLSKKLEAMAPIDLSALNPLTQDVIAPLRRDQRFAAYFR